MSPKPKIEIRTESDFREKVGLTEPVSLEWKEGQVIASTQDALDRLKKNMEGKAEAKKREIAEAFIRANEKKDAMSKLEDRLTDGLWKKLLTNPAVLATTGAVATWVGMMVHKLDKKVEDATGEKIGLMQSIRDWLKDAIEESDSKFMKWVFTLLYKIIGGKEDWDTEEERTNIWWEQSGSTEKPREHREGIVHYKGYEMIATHIFNRWHRKAFDGVWSAMWQAVRDATWKKNEVEAQKELNRAAQEIITSDFIKWKTFAELTKYQKNIESMDTIGQDPKRKAAAQMALDVLCGVENEKFMDKELQKALPDWRNKRMWESMVAIYRGWWWEKIDMIKEKLHWIDWSQPSDFLKRLPEMLLHKKDSGEYDGIVGNNIASLRSQGLSNTIIERTLMPGLEGSTKVSNYERYLQEHSMWEQGADNFMKSITAPDGFSKKIQWTLDQFDLGNYKSDFWRENLTVRQLLMLYILTKWETDIDAMNKGVRTELFLALAAMIAEKHPFSSATDQFLKFLQTPTNRHVQEIINLLWVWINRTAYEWILKSIGWWKDAIDAINEIREKSPTIFYGAIWVITISATLAYYARVPFLVTAGTLTILKVAAGAAWVTYLGSSGK